MRAESVSFPRQLSCTRLQQSSSAPQRQHIERPCPHRNRLSNTKRWSAICRIENQVAIHSSVMYPSLDETRLRLVTGRHSGTTLYYAQLDAATHCSTDCPFAHTQTLTNAKSASKPTHEGNYLGVSASPFERNFKHFVLSWTW